MRITVLTYGRTGYLDAALRAAHAQGDELLVVAPAHAEDTAFGSLGIDGVARCITWTTPPASPELVAAVDAFDPDVVMRMSWTPPRAYRDVLATRPAGVLRVLMMDNVWLGTPKQWAGRVAHRVLVDPYFDCVLVPSDRTEFFARRLGFGAADVIRGCWSADTDLFGAAPHDGADLAARRRFIAVGRLVEHKGADLLAAAYARYRASVPAPWDLDVVGIGPLAAAFDGIPGVTMHGFRQPAEVAGLMHRASCFVLPSRAEPYGVVVHEAAAAALPMLCTDFAAAVPMFLQDGFNGWTVASGHVDEWVAALARMSSAPAARLGEMSAGSAALSTRITPRGWARHLRDEFSRRLARLGDRAVTPEPSPTPSTQEPVR